MATTTIETSLVVRTARWNDPADQTVAIVAPAGTTVLVDNGAITPPPSPPGDVTQALTGVGAAGAVGVITAPGDKTAALTGVGAGGHLGSVSLPSSGNVHAYNVSRFGGFFDGRNLYPFLNFCKIGGGWQFPSGTITYDADNWPTLAAGASTRFLVIATLNPDGGNFPSGDYKYKSTSNGLTMTPVSSAGVSAIVAGAAGLATFTFTDPGHPSIGSTIIAIDLWNQTGSPIVMTDLVCVRTDEESLLTNGEIFRPDFLAPMAGASVLRMKDWQFQDELWENLNRKTFADLGSQNESKPTYAAHGLGESGATPLSIMVKLCKKIGADCWLTLPYGGNNCFWTRDADGTIHSIERAPFGDFPRPHRLSNGTQVGICGFDFDGVTGPAIAPILSTVRGPAYYVVNATANTFQVSLSIGGAAIAPTTPANLTSIDQTGFSTWQAITNNSPETVLWPQMIQKCFDTDPTVRLWIEWGSEVWNNYANTAYATHVGYRQAGVYDNTQVGSIGLGIGHSYLSMLAWKTAEVIYPASNITRVFGQFTASPITKLLNNYVDPGLITTGQTLGQIMAATASRSAYACAPYMTQDLDGFAFGNFSATHAYAINGNSLTFSDAFWHATFEGAAYPGGFGILAGETWMAQCKAQRDAQAPGVPLVFYEWGHQVVMNGGDGTLTDAQKIGVFNSFKSYIDGAGGLALYQEGYARLAAAFGVARIAHYSSVGGYNPGAGGMQYWGLQNTSVDTPRSTWFRTL